MTASDPEDPMLETSSAALNEAQTQTRRRSSPRLWLGPDHRLWLEHAGRTVSVQPVRCFPWSAPGELISLRDAEEQEQHLVESPEDLDPSSREALASSMLSAGFVLEIEAILSVEEDYEVRIWKA